MRVLYAGLGATVHDRRFVGAFVDFGWDVAVIDIESAVSLCGERWPPQVEVIGGPDPRSSDTPALASALEHVGREWRPDIVFAGPLTSWGVAAAEVGIRPVAAVSWGFDLLVEARSGHRARAAAETALRSCSLLVCDSDAVRVEAIARDASIVERLVQLPWGVDLTSFHPDAVPLHPRMQEHFRALSLRTWGPLYDVPTVVRAVGLARRRIPHLRLVLAGEGEDAPGIHRQITELGLQDAVTTPGRLPQRDLPAWYTSADVYVSAAPQDGTSISLLEAMASGLPVIVVDNPGNREWVSPAGGYLVPSRDPDAMAGAVVALAGLAPEERTRLGRHNRAVAEERADWTRNRERLRAALETTYADSA